MVKLQNGKFKKKRLRFKLKAIV